MLERVIWGNSIERWLISAVILVAALVVGRIASGLMRSLAKRTRWKAAGVIAEQIGGPVMIFALVFGLRVAIEALEMQPNEREMLTKAITMSVGIVVTWLFVQAYDALHRGIFEPYAKSPDARIELHLFVVLRTIVNILLWTVGLASTLNSIGFEISAVLAALGIGGVALALASQDTVANFFGGVIVLTQRPFKVGERIEVDGIDGWVHRLGLRTTIVKNWYGREVSIPNKRFTDSVVINIDSQSCYYQEALIRLDPRTTADQVDLALQILGEIVRDTETLDKQHWAALDKIGHGYLELDFWYAVSKFNAADQGKFPNWYGKVCRAKTDVNVAIMRRFESAGLQLALPMDVRWNIDLSASPDGRRPEPPRALLPPYTAELPRA
jgi:MscS family membrane protein